MTSHPLGILKQDGTIRRYIVLRYDASYLVWDRHDKKAITGHIRVFAKAVAMMKRLNGEPT